MMLSKKYAIAVLLFTTVFLVYFNTLAPTITAVGDSGELIVAAYTGGIPHAPGYPLYTMLGHLAVKLPLGPSIAWRMNFLSSVFHALTVLVLFLAIVEVLDNLTKKDLHKEANQNLKIIAALVASLVLAFSYIFWLYAVVAEVFSLNNFFAMLLVLVGLKWRRTLLDSQTKKSQQYLLVLALVFGLALTNHQSIIMLLPAFLYLFVLTINQADQVSGRSLSKRLLNYFRPKLIGMSAAVFLLGLLPYLYLPIQAAKNPPVNWGNPSNLERFVRVITRADYGIFNLSPQVALQPEESFGVLGQITNFAKSLYDSTSFLTLSFVFFGLGVLSKKSRLDLVFLLLLFLGPSAIFLLSPELPVSGVWQTVIQRFYLLPLLIVPIVAAVGIYWVGVLVGSTLANWIANLKLITLLTGFCFLMVIIVPSYRIQKVKAEQTGNTLLYDFGQCILSTLPQNSIFLTYGENTWSALHYLKLVEKKREDIILIDQAGFTYPWYQNEVEKNYGSKIKLPEPKQKSGSILTNLISINLDQYPTFAQTLFDKKALLDFQTIPWGLVLQFMPEKTRVNPDEILQENKTFFANCPIPDLTPSNYPPFSYERDLVYNWSRAYARIGEFAVKYQKWQEAVFWYQKSVEIWPENATFQRGLREALYKLDKTKEK